MGALAVISKLRYSLRRHGAADTWRLIAKNLSFLVYQRFGRAFDQRHGVDTFGRVALADLAIASENRRFGIYYEPSPSLTFKRLLKRLPADLRDFTFVDFGCGKGRTLIAAHPFGFKRIVGVEFSHELCEIARANVARLGLEVEVVEGDAVEFAIPDGPCVLYFYNPFDAPVLERVVANVERSWRTTPRKLFVVYLNAMENARQFEHVDCLRLRTRGKFLFDPGAERRRPYAIWESLDA